MLQELTLQNFKKHKALTIPFPDGLTAISGNNAAGKSTILKGILFALFGSAAVGAKEHIWSWGSSDKRKVALKLTLPVYGDVLITRTPSGAAVVDMEGKNLASGHTAVTKFIEESLGMLAKDLKTICYSPQGETQNVLTMGPAALQQKVEGLARVDVLDNVLALVATDLSKLEGRLGSFPENMDIAGLEANLQLLQGHRAARDKDMGISLDMHKKYLEEKNRINGELQTALGYQQTREKLQADLQRFESTITQHEGQLLKLDTRKSELNAALGGADIETLQIAYVDARAAYDTAVQELSKSRDLVTRYNTLQKDVEKYKPAVVEHHKAVEVLALVLPDLKEKAATEADLRTKAAHANQTLFQLGQALHDSTCPTCKRKMEGVDPVKLQAEYDEAKTVVDQLIAELATAAKAVVELQAKEKELNRNVNYSAVDMLDTLTLSLAEIGTVDEQRVHSATAVVSEATIKTNQIVEALNKATATTTSLKEVEAQIKSLQESQKQLHAQSRDCKRRLEQVPVLDVTNLQLQFVKCSNNVDAAAQQIQDYRLEVANYDSRIQATTLELGNLKKLEAERQQLTDELTKLGQFQKHLKTNRSRWANDIWEGLLQYASSLISNTTSGVLSNLTRSDKGEFRVEETGQNIPVEEASGFQKSLIGTALRVALSKVFYGDNLFLLLDEATADANDENAAAVAGMLASLNMQVVMVSHRGGDAVNAGNLVELNGYDKGRKS